MLGSAADRVDTVSAIVAPDPRGAGDPNLGGVKGMSA